MSTSGIAARPLRPLRIIAMPLTRVWKRPMAPSGTTTQKSLHSQNSVPPILTHYHFELRSKLQPSSIESTVNLTSSRSSSWLPKEGVVNWATAKSLRVWVDFGKAQEGSLKLRVYQTGERLADRLDFEEHDLKAFDVTLGPTVAEVKAANTTIPLHYPPSINSPSEAIEQLRSMAVHRARLHRKGLYLWLSLIPFTFPLKFIPIIPNLPFFFCAWRSWSHYRAYKASQYIGSLLDSGAIVPYASAELDKIYAEYAPRPEQLDQRDSSDETPTPDTQTPNPESNVSVEHSYSTDELARSLLTGDAVAAVIKAFDLDSSASTNMNRAIEQTRARIRDGRA